ncbi:hypothetical protein AMES_6768 [Amycolatopsis mediterranei S699]|uniref:Enediyne biosynthesis protein n=2 Tax=Amycolatopsis mediterranei TaxID=33910 RepID=A0A0H3DFZ8_AMYMU|nr:DUF1702 family protein [Amycolatopsis mediterranei]ADJ48594.1 conserved hypothetical protein [Amycolatopsis mediterranei U32]AEK45526.1 hypothetical protein RAM_35265 [Amycolatopsis mediterranei S699]AFO80303.1 hypothetical protein AMES_6768 [Amycolatopsis mediterranei S699]AGT87431.1 hypothetical protein B737_6768 [Amycolatopsis mediterranei RB]KDO11203.1 enediyne biosynthesis protein [Amycolatopsis mediterranei]
MSSFIGVLRKQVLAPSFASVGFAGRNFPVTHTDATARLEAVPQAVVCGFEWAIEGASLWEIERRLALIEPEQRGFAYEGATMGYTILDAMPGGGRDRTRALLEGPGRPHIFLTYIGIGFAMARLPRPLWKNILPELTGVPYHPVMSWLAVDGYGFDRAYFDTRRWVDEQAEPEPYPWAGRPEYFARAFDQGVGRALWFINGGVPSAVAEAVGRFAEPRRADLWSGVGLASTFAGGTDQAGYGQLRRAAGEYFAELALGVVFAVKARTYSGHVPAHTHLAAGVLVNLSVQGAQTIADRTEAADGDDGPEPPYELWRERIRRDFRDALGRLAG